VDVRPERERAAPVTHGAVGIELLRGLEGADRLRVVEGVHEPDTLVEVLLRQRRGGRDRHVVTRQTVEEAAEAGRGIQSLRARGGQSEEQEPGCHTERLSQVTQDRLLQLRIEAHARLTASEAMPSRITTEPRRSGKTKRMRPPATFLSSAMASASRASAGSSARRGSPARPTRSSTSARTSPPATPTSPASVAAARSPTPTASPCRMRP